MAIGQRLARTELLSDSSHPQSRGRSALLETFPLQLFIVFPIKMRWAKTSSGIAAALALVATASPTGLTSSLLPPVVHIDPAAPLSPLAPHDFAPFAHLAVRASERPVSDHDGLESRDIHMVRETVAKTGQSGEKKLKARNPPGAATTVHVGRNGDRPGETNRTRVAIIQYPESRNQLPEACSRASGKFSASGRAPGHPRPQLTAPQPVPPPAQTIAPQPVPPPASARSTRPARGSGSCCSRHHHHHHHHHHGLFSHEGEAGRCLYCIPTALCAAFCCCCLLG